MKRVYYDGVTFLTRPGTTDRTVLRETWVEDVYQSGVVEGFVCVDLGANIGAWTVYAAHHGAEAVHAYEPDPDNRAVLELNTADYVTVTIWPEGVLAGDAPSFVTSRQGEAGNAHFGDGGDLHVPTVTLSEVIDRAGGHVDFLKADIEGSEYRMDWTEQNLQRIDRMAMEFDGSDVRKQDGGSFGSLVTGLAEWGHVTTFGAPSRGGYLFWRRYRA